MRKSEDLFEFNFYKIKENRYQVIIAICIYFLLSIVSVLLGLYIYGFDKNIIWGLNKQTIDNLAMLGIVVFFIFITPMVGIFKIFMYSRLVYTLEVFDSKIVVENVFGQQTKIENYEIYEGFSDYVQSYRCLWMKGENYIKEELIENKGWHFTVRDMNTGLFYLLTIDPSRKGE
ncbi:hypothetical protein ACG95P_18855 [Acinetobacter guillouiae]|jgi:ABC-type multidrug transport system fused ATPase/permease subunit|uniref:hypothetical protein n=1 Tax=Acinetobacter TaxID=469 RepID=UPI003AF46007